MATSTRPSRVARTRGTPIETTDRSTVRQQIIPRETPNLNAGMDARMRLSQQMGSFFGTAFQSVNQAVTANELVAIEKENHDLATEATRRASENPRAAAEAIKSGDLSSFAPNQEALQRRAFVETFKMTTGRAMAAEDASRFENDVLKSLNFDGDPFAARDDFLKKQTAGSSDPMFEAAYNTKFRQSTEGSINAWVGQKAVFQAAKGQDRRSGVLVSDLDAGRALGLEDLNKYVADMINLAPPGARADSEQKAIARWAFEASRRGNQSALAALGQPDATRSGLAVSDIYPQVVQQAFDASVAEHRKVRTLAAQNDLDSIDLTLKAFESGVPALAAHNGVVPTLSDVGTSIARHASIHGNSEQWQSMFGRYAHLLKTEGDYSAGFEKAMTGLVPGAPAAAIPDKWWNAYGQRFAQDAKLSLLARGFTEDQADARLGRLAALYNGFGKTFNDGLQHDLTRNPDPGKKLSAYRTLKAIAAENPDSIDDILGEEAATKFFYAESAEDNRGQSPLEALKEFDGIDREKLGNWKTYLSRTQPTLQRDAMTKSVVRKLDEANRLLDVSSWSNTPVSDEVKSMIETELSRTAWLTANKGTFDADRITETTVKTIANRIELGVDDEGRRIAVPRRTPRRLVTDDGRIVAGRPLDEAMQDHAKAAYDANRLVWGNLIGTGIKGVRPDAFGTPRGFGYEVVVEDAAGVAGPVELDAGEYSLPEGALGFEHDPDSKLTLPVIPPKDGIPLDRQGTLRLMPHPAIPRRYKLYYTGPAQPSPEEQSMDQTEKLLTKGAELDRLRLDQTLNELGIAPKRGSMTPGLRKLEDSLREREDLVNQNQSALGARLRGVPGAVIRLPSGRGEPVTNNNVSLGDTSSFIGDHFDNAITGMVENGSIPPSALIENAGRGKLTDEDAISREFNRVIEGAKLRGSMFDTNRTPYAEVFMEDARKWLGQMEGKRLVAYDDYTGQPIRPGSKVKGDPTIAYGFNLNRPDAKSLVESLGLDFAKVKSGEQSLSDEQAEFLKDVVIKDNLSWLRDHFKGIPLARHQVLALLSLTYNSRWTDRGPTLIGPKLTQFIREGNYEAAANEIENNSNSGKGLPKGVAASIDARRAREAALFRGDLHPDNFA